IYTKATRKRVMSKRKLQRCRGGPLSDVDVSILYHYSYINVIEFSAYLFIHLHLQCSCTFTFTFSNLADAFVQRDVQEREQSSYEHWRPSVTINTTLHKKKKNEIENKKEVQECNCCKCKLSTSRSASLGREVLSEELGLQKLLKGREGRPCSGSAGQLIPPTWNYKYIIYISICKQIGRAHV